MSIETRSVKFLGYLPSPEIIKNIFFVICGALILNRFLNSGEDRYQLCTLYSSFIYFLSPMWGIHK